MRPTDSTGCVGSIDQIDGELQSSATVIVPLTRGQQSISEVLERTNLMLRQQRNRQFENTAHRLHHLFRRELGRAAGEVGQIGKDDRRIFSGGFFHLLGRTTAETLDGTTRILFRIDLVEDSTDLLLPAGVIGLDRPGESLIELPDRTLVIALGHLLLGQEQASEDLSFADGSQRIDRLLQRLLPVGISLIRWL